MKLSCGIVGLPNIGKSTLFNALTSSKAAVENYPFCTITPNVGLALVHDERLSQLAKLAHSEKVIPAVVEFVDIAGLVAGAANNAGLGNQFLGHIRETAAIIHAVRCFENDKASGDITHVGGKISPADDIAVINTELALADLATIEKTLASTTKTARSGDKAAKAMCVVCEKMLAHLSADGMARNLTLSEEEKPLIGQLFLLTMKPLLYVANVSESGFQNNPYLDKVREIAEGEKTAVVAVSAKLEAEIADLPAAEQAEFLSDLELSETGLSRLTSAAFSLLNLINYFTVGPKESRAWTIKRGENAKEAAGAIHTDFTQKFIRAEVCSCENYLKFGSETAAKSAGKIISEGATYIVQDGDVMHFRI